jgi:hypothetical protein
MARLNGAGRSCGRQRVGSGTRNWSRTSHPPSPGSGPVSGAQPPARGWSRGQAAVKRLSS